MAMSRLKYSISEIQRMIYDIHGNVVKIDQSTYVGIEKKARFIDKDYGEWWTKPSKVIHRRQGHKKRGLEKAKKTFLDKYGVDNPSKHQVIRKKITATCLKKYGVDNPSKHKDISKKISKTFDAKTKEEKKNIVKKRINTNIATYGVTNPMQNDKVKKRASDTLYTNYGVRVPSKNKIIVDRIKQTCLKKYGVDNVSKNQEIKEKIKYTCLKKYGAKSSMLNEKVAAKNARNQNRSIILKHWKTDSELVCIGSYEVAVVNYLNKNKIDFEWQPKYFIMPNGKRYRPDLYLVKEKKWIEIKGYFRKDAREKWEWFSENHCADLWNKNRLKYMGIL